MLQVQKLSEEWNKRITEHDNAVAEGFEKTEITISVRWFVLYWNILSQKRRVGVQWLGTGH